MVESLDIASDTTRVSVVPGRGGIVSALEIDGREVLFMDASTLADATKNVRGGIPVLFPFAGKLVDETLLASGARMKQHGFGRDRVWTVEAHDAATLTMSLVADAVTRAAYPWDFAAEVVVRALPRGVRVELAVTNRSDTALPLSPGWHPYFACPTEAKAAFHADVAGLVAGVLDDVREHDFGVVAPGDGIARLHIDDRVLWLSFAPLMRHLQVWTLPGRAFVCVEPFWGPADSINGPARATVAPGETFAVWMQIESD